MSTKDNSRNRFTFKFFQFFIIINRLRSAVFDGPKSKFWLAEDARRGLY